MTAHGPWQRVPGKDVIIAPPLSTITLGAVQAVARYLKLPAECVQPHTIETESPSARVGILGARVEGRQALTAFAKDIGVQFAGSAEYRRPGYDGPKP